jgi:hypothetical protein
MCAVPGMQGEKSVESGYGTKRWRLIGFKRSEDAISLHTYSVLFKVLPDHQSRLSVFSDRFSGMRCSTFTYIADDK